MSGKKSNESKVLCFRASLIFDFSFLCNKFELIHRIGPKSSHEKEKYRGRRARKPSEWRPSCPRAAALRLPRILTQPRRWLRKALEWRWSMQMDSATSRPSFPSLHTIGKRLTMIWLHPLRIHASLLRIYPIHLSLQTLQ